MKNKYIRAFIAASSFPVIFIPFMYLGISITANPEAWFNFFYEAVSVPILFGLINMLFVLVRDHIHVSPTAKYWIWGAGHGLFFSLLWNFWLHVPEKLFLLSGPIQYITIPGAMILYACIWRFIVRPMNVLVHIDK